MTRTTLLVNGEPHGTFENKQQAAEYHQEAIADGTISPSSDDVQYRPEWVIEEHYENGTIYFRNADREATIYLEYDERRETDDEWPFMQDYKWNVGIFDRTVSSVTIPNSRAAFPSKEKAFCHAFTLALNLDEYLEEFRSSETVERVYELQERAPPTRQEGGVIRQYQISRRQHKVYDGRMTVDEAVEELEEEVEFQERMGQT